MKCLECDKQIKSGKYCSNQCQGNYQGKQVLNDWLSGKSDGTRSGLRLKGPIRTYVLEQAENKCSQCGWNAINPTTGKCPLEIDHIDGNCSNNRPENLRVLCPNCHSLTDSWKALNKGKGNKQRHAYYGLIAQG